MCAESSRHTLARFLFVQYFWTSVRPTVEIVISEQWSWKVAWFLKEHYCPAKNHTTLHDHVLLVTFSTVRPLAMTRWCENLSLRVISILLPEIWYYCVVGKLQRIFFVNVDSKLVRETCEISFRNSSWALEGFLLLCDREVAKIFLDDSKLVRERYFLYSPRVVSILSKMWNCCVMSKSERFISTSNDTKIM